MPGGTAFFGGTFNPIHVGHLITARAVAEYLDLARVILIPAGRPPHRWPGELADPRDRLEMVRLAVQDEPRLQASDIEIQQEGITHAIRSVEAYQGRLPPASRLHWIIGADLLMHLGTWHRAREFVDLCQIVTALREGHAVPDFGPLIAAFGPEQIDRIRAGVVPTPRVDISSTEIRWRVRERRSIRYLVPEAVRAYILERGLYRVEAPTAPETRTANRDPGELPPDSGPVE